MGLCFYQEIDYFSYDKLVQLEKETMGELKIIRFYKNLRADRKITEKDEELLVSWERGERLNEEIE
jgi:predicted N-acyltransferase